MGSEGFPQFPTEQAEQVTDGSATGIAVLEKNRTEERVPRTRWTRCRARNWAMGKGAPITPDERASRRESGKPVMPGLAGHPAHLGWADRPLHSPA